MCLCTVSVAHTWKFCAYRGVIWWRMMELSALHDVLTDCARLCAKERHRLVVITVLCYLWSCSSFSNSLVHVTIAVGLLHCPYLVEGILASVWCLSVPLCIYSKWVTVRLHQHFDPSLWGLIHLLNVIWNAMICSVYVHHFGLLNVCHTCINWNVFHRLWQVCCNKMPK